MHPRLLRLHARRAGTITIRVRVSTAIRRVRIMAGELGLLSGAHVLLPVLLPVLLRIVRRLGLPRVLQLVQPAAVAGAVVEAAAGAGEV